MASWRAGFAHGVDAISAAARFCESAGAIERGLAREYPGLKVECLPAFGRIICRERGHGADMAVHDAAGAVVIVDIDRLARDDVAAQRRAGLQKTVPHRGDFVQDDLRPFWSTPSRSSHAWRAPARNRPQLPAPMSSTMDSASAMRAGKPGARDRLGWAASSRVMEARALVPAGFGTCRNCEGSQPASLP